MPHSCDPNADVMFSEGTSILYLVAKKDIKTGEELSIAYVDVTQHEAESVQVARLRRRQALASGWAIVCTCKRCVEEAPVKASGGRILPEKEKEETTENNTISST